MYRGWGIGDTKLMSHLLKSTKAFSPTQDEIRFSPKNYVRKHAEVLFPVVQDIVHKRASHAGSVMEQRISSVVCALKEELEKHMAQKTAEMETNTWNFVAKKVSAIVKRQQAEEKYLSNKDTLILFHYLFSKATGGISLDDADELLLLNHPSVESFESRVLECIEEDAKSDLPTDISDLPNAVGLQKELVTIAKILSYDVSKIPESRLLYAPGLKDVVVADFLHDLTTFNREGEICREMADVTFPEQH